MDEITRKQKRIAVYIEEWKHNKLRAKLASKGQTVSGWFRKIVDNVIKET